MCTYIWLALIVTYSVQVVFRVGSLVMYVSLGSGVVWVYGWWASPFKTYLWIGWLEEPNGVHEWCRTWSGQPRSRTGHGDHVKLPAQIYRPCAAPVRLGLVSRGRFATTDVSDPPSEHPGAYT